MEKLRGATAPKSRIRIEAKVKTFVLDTNVLLHDPQSIFKFEDNNLAIPVEVLEELDAINAEGPSRATLVRATEILRERHQQRAGR